MAMFFKRLAKAAPIAFSHAFRDQPKSSFPSFRVPFGAITAISGGISYYYYFSSPNLVESVSYLKTARNSENPTSEGATRSEVSGVERMQLPKFNSDPELLPFEEYEEISEMDKKTEEQNETGANSSQDDSFHAEADMVSDLDMWTHFVPSRGLETNAFEAKTGCAEIISDLDMYTPISDPDSKGYFDLLINVYPDGKMSQPFASLKPGDVVEKGPIEKLRYSPNMKKHIGMVHLDQINEKMGPKVALNPNKWLEFKL